MTKQKRGEYGTNTIKLGVKFWTNNLPEGADKKTAWKSGTIYLYDNKTKKIGHDMIRFNDINADFMEKLLGLLRNNGIKLIEIPKEKFKVVNK